MQPLPESPYRLLVEGEDDKHSIIHLLARHSFNWDDEGTVRPYVSPEGSVERLLRALPVAIKSAHSRVGVVLDADLDLLLRWSQVRNRLENAGLVVPERPPEGGAILHGLRPGTRIGVWIMPDNSAPGILEDFLSKLVPSEDPIWGYAGEVASEARRRGARCRETDHLKSRLHTWLAWQERPGLPFGTALNARVLNHESEEALRFVAWFHSLFLDS